jgi:hypothetical protein
MAKLLSKAKTWFSFSVSLLIIALLGLTAHPLICVCVLFLPLPLSSLPRQ